MLVTICSNHQIKFTSPKNSFLPKMSLRNKLSFVFCKNEEYYTYLFWIFLLFLINFPTPRIVTCAILTPTSSSAVLFPEASQTVKVSMNWKHDSIFRSHPKHFVKNWRQAVLPHSRLPLSGLTIKIDSSVNKNDSSDNRDC